MTDWLTASDEASALELLHARQCTDGLPVVIPTDERVQRMVIQSSMAGDMQLGVMGPAGKVATVEKVAVAAVMAGCLPDYMPVVVAAVQAILKPEFDLTEMQATTHCTAPLLIVNGLPDVIVGRYQAVSAHWGRDTGPMQVLVERYAWL